MELLQLHLALSDHVLEQLTQPVQAQMNTAVLCNDLYYQFDMGGAFEAYRSAEAPGLIHGAEILATYIARCERYGLGSEGGEPAQPVASDLPVLAVKGGIDREP